MVVEATRNRRARHVTFAVIAFVALNGVGAVLLADFGGGDDDGGFDIDVQGNVVEAEATETPNDDGGPDTTVQLETINSLLAEDGTLVDGESTTTAPSSSTTQAPTTQPSTTQAPTTARPSTTQAPTTRPPTTAPTTQPTTTTTAPPTTPPTTQPTTQSTAPPTSPVPTFSIPDGGEIASSVVERLPEVVLPGDGG